MKCTLHLQLNDDCKYVPEISQSVVYSNTTQTVNNFNIHRFNQSVITNTIRP